MPIPRQTASLDLLLCNCGRISSTTLQYVILHPIVPKLAETALSRRHTSWLGTPLGKRDDSGFVAVGLLLLSDARVGRNFFEKSLSLLETAEGWLGLSACLLLQHQQQQQQLLLQQYHDTHNPQQYLQQQQQQKRTENQLLQEALDAAAAANTLNPNRAESWGFLCLASLGLGKERQAAVCCRFFFKTALRASNTLARHSTIVFRDPFLPLPAATATGTSSADATAATVDDARSASPREAAAAAGVTCSWTGGLTLRLAAALLQQHQEKQHQQGMKSVQTAHALAVMQTPEDTGKPTYSPRKRR